MINYNSSFGQKLKFKGKNPLSTAAGKPFSRSRDRNSKVFNSLGRITEVIAEAPQGMDSGDKTPDLIHNFIREHSSNVMIVTCQCDEAN